MTDKNKNPENSGSFETSLTHSGRETSQQHGFVNTPVTRGSTVVFATLEGLHSGQQAYRYGRTGNPNSESVESLLNDLEGAEGTVLTPSGLSAISIALLSCLKAGDEVLVTDSAYEPTRKFCNKILAKMNISTRYFDPRIGAGIADIISENTRAILMESPGSLTFEVQDIPAIVAVAKRRDITTLVDNTWATPLYLRPLALGADMVMHAATKMFSGHSDVSMGTISANAKWWPALRETHNHTGTCASPDDCYLIARGLRTLAIRMKEHNARTVEIARWLEGQDGVLSVLHPALASHPDHEIFMRDFSGSGCLFSIILKPAPKAAVAAMVDDMALFGLGYSWGGFESLILPASPGKVRTAVPWSQEGNLVRLHIGLEDIDDLKVDLSAGLARYRTAPE